MVSKSLFLLENDWEVTTLAEACSRGGGEIQTGPFGSQLHAADYVEKGVPSIMPQNIGDNRINEQGIARITPEDAYRLRRYLVREGDIVYSRRGDVERKALVRSHEDGWLCGTGCLRVRFGHDSIINPLYASFYLSHPNVRRWIVQHAHGATMPNLNTSILGALPFIIPPADEQRRIAHILGTLDDKIELNRQLNATLGQLARTLFQSWFVDFDPVRAKASGEPEESICRRLGLTPELLALFPAALEDSAMGEIPAGWEVKSLDEIATFLNGVAAQKYPPQGKDDLPVIKIAQLRKGNTVGADVANASTVPTAYVVENGDVLFSWSGSLEVEIWGGGLGILNQHLFKVESEYFPKWFYFMWTRHHLPSFRLTAADKATTMGHIQRKHLTNAKVLVPPAALLEKMTVKFSPLLAQAEDFALESRTLAALRDELLPQLLSGELRVSESTYGASKASL